MKVRQVLERRLLEAQRRLGGVQAGGVVHDVGDEGDLGVQADLRDLSTADRARLLSLVELLRGALARVDAGEYGVCLDCGDAIPRARLNAIPEAETCVRCQERRERRAPRDGAVTRVPRVAVGRLLQEDA